MNKKSIITLVCVLIAILVLIFAVVNLINNDDASETPKDESSYSSESVGASEPDSTISEPQKNDEATRDEVTTGVQTEINNTDKTQTDKKPEGTTSSEKPETSKPIEDTTSIDVPQPELPPVVPVVPDKEEDKDEPNVLTFPAKVEGYGLTIEKIAPYNGTYVEDGTNATVEDVAMLLIINNGDYPIEYAQIKVQYEQSSLLFDLTALPVGAKVVVQEKNGNKMPSGEAISATAMVLQEAELSLSQDSVSVVDNGNNTLTVKNLTDKIIHTVRVFYKYYMEEENVFVGGISFTVKLTRMGPGESVTIQPSHFTSKTSRVVMVLTYNSEV